MEPSCSKRTDGQTDRHDEAILRTRQKKPLQNASALVFWIFALLFGILETSRWNYIPPS